MWLINCTWEYTRGGESQGRYVRMRKMYYMVEEGARGGRELGNRTGVS